MLEILKSVRAVWDPATLLYPSFALPMFSIHDSIMVKDYGVCSGLRVKATSSGYLVSHDSVFCLNYADYILGLWFDIESALRDVRSVFREVIDYLIGYYPSYGIAVSHLDDIIVFMSIFLSKNTNYHVNTVRWVKRILASYSDPLDIIHSDLEDVLASISSIQVRELPKALRYYYSVRGSIIKGGSEDSRLLLEYKGIGPKTLYSYILHVKLDSSYAPFDVNFEKFLLNLGFRLWSRRPDKRYCRLYTCPTCPQSSSCSIGVLRSSLGKALGWLQTVAYIHVKRACRVRACRECPLRRICIARSYS
ncbi:MAG: hypothetical protein QXR02_02625 [Acidilobaceae archaeon]